MTARSFSILAAGCWRPRCGDDALATSHEQKHFATPEAAVAALIAALGRTTAGARGDDRSDQKDLIDSGDPVADRLAAGFVERYDPPTGSEDLGHARRSSRWARTTGRFRFRS
jgi:hypothetical protein